MNEPDTIAVIDFASTGMSPAMGARATEIAAVLVRAGSTPRRPTTGWASWLGIVRPGAPTAR